MNHLLLELKHTVHDWAELHSDRELVITFIVLTYMLIAILGAAITPANKKGYDSHEGK
jgi:hypothetical protein